MESDLTFEFYPIQSKKYLLMPNNIHDLKKREKDNSKRSKWSIPKMVENLQKQFNNRLGHYLAANNSHLI